MGARKPARTISHMREAVDAEVVADGGGGDPGQVLLKLEGAGARQRS